ncbi:MAG: TatD family hydrolase [Methanobacterium sp.]|uniref:TatD family hydrolase n=1 Tax=Methanobacterium sp. TaxID=2164 RepID=UPI003D6498D2|nr:TatD family hydrolase [Methanobacterium sp.]
MENIIITDNHIHVDPINGEGPLEVAKKFRRAGGNVMIIPNKPTWTVGKSCSFKDAMELVIKYVNEINENTDVRAFAVVGAHPAELSRLIKEGIKLKKAEQMMKDAFKTAQMLITEGKAIGIGEIGRPHYEVSPEELQIHNNLILYAMELAADADCAIQLHTESAAEEQFLEFAEIADKAGLARYKVIKHFSGPLVNKEENHSLTPSLIATRDVVTKGLKKGNGFLMETDYLDMKSRPGAVLGPKTVPRRTNELLRNETMTEDDAYKIHVETVKKVYGIDID